MLLLLLSFLHYTVQMLSLNDIVKIPTFLAMGSEKSYGSTELTNFPQKKWKYDALKYPKFVVYAKTSILGLNLTFFINWVLILSFAV